MDREDRNLCLFMLVLVFTLLALNTVLRWLNP